jgi:putative membrane protein
VAVRFLDEEARAEFKTAVETIENASAAEVVVAVRRRASRYPHAHALVGAVAAFAALAVMLYAAQSFSILAVLLDPFAAAAVAAALVELAPPIQRWLTPARVRAAHVTRAARAAFVERGVSNTTGRSGILVYVAWLEQRIALVADSGLVAADFDAPAAERTLQVELPRGGAAVARALAKLAPQFARALPHRDDDVNELPDAIDEAPL